MPSFGWESEVGRGICGVTWDADRTRCRKAGSRTRRGMCRNGVPPWGGPGRCIIRASVSTEWASRRNTGRCGRSWFPECGEAALRGRNPGELPVYREGGRVDLEEPVERRICGGPRAEIGAGGERIIGRGEVLRPERCVVVAQDDPACRVEPVPVEPSFRLAKRKAGLTHWESQNHRAPMRHTTMVLVVMGFAYLHPSGSKENPDTPAPELIGGRGWRGGMAESKSCLRCRAKDEKFTYEDSKDPHSGYSRISDTDGRRS